MDLCELVIEDVEGGSFRVHRSVMTSSVLEFLHRHACRSKSSVACPAQRAPVAQRLLDVLERLRSQSLTRKHRTIRPKLISLGLFKSIVLAYLLPLVLQDKLTLTT